MSLNTEPQAREVQWIPAPLRDWGAMITATCHFTLYSLCQSSRTLTVGISIVLIILRLKAKPLGGLQKSATFLISSPNSPLETTQARTARIVHPAAPKGPRAGLLRHLRSLSTWARSQHIYCICRPPSELPVFSATVLEAVEAFCHNPQPVCNRRVEKGHKQKPEKKDFYKLAEQF